MDEELMIVLDDPNDIDLILDDGEQVFMLTEETPIVDDYNLLRNKPKINGIELRGNIPFEDFFPDGLVLDGGDAN